MFKRDFKSIQKKCRGLFFGLIAISLFQGCSVNSSIERFLQLNKCVDCNLSKLDLERAT